MSQFGRSFTNSGPGAFIQTITGNIGVVTPVAGNVNIVGGSNIFTTGVGDTLTIDVSGTTDHALQVGSVAGSLNSLPVAANGQLPIGSAGVDPVIANLTPGAGIAILNGPGSITISATGSAGLSWQVIAANQAAVADEGYFTNAGGVVQLMLPAASAVGDTFEVAAMSAGGWQIIQGAGQQIRIGNQTTTLGGAGSISSLAIGDWITLVCNVANLSWMAHSEQGNFNVA